MISKTILKQTIKANYKLWCIFTAILTAIMVLMVVSYDPSMISTLTKAIEGTAMADTMGDQLSSMTSLLGSLSNQFYGMLATLLPLIYIIIVANSLVASEVDRGSMAYTLSTPTTRTSVILTKAVFLISSLILMFTIVTGAGILTTQIKHVSVWGTNYTSDVKAVAEDLDMSKADIAADLNLILSNEQELQIGANARNIEVDVYKAYLTLAMQDAEGTTSEQTMSDEQKSSMQEKMMAGLTAAATTLNMDVSDLSSDMGIIKENESSLTAACEASELPKEMFVNIINQQLAATELTNDEAVDFDLSNFIMLNIGVLLFLFAISGISFLASSAANLSKYSLTFGAGIPIAFFLFKTVAQTSDSLEVFKYFTLNTLYDASAIAEGTIEILPLVVLLAIGILMYFLSVQVFKRKDLPL